MNIDVIQADYANEAHAADIVFLMDYYAQDIMGGGKALPEKVKNSLVSELAKIPSAYTVLCYVDGKPAGLTNFFEAFSTFKCKPLVNIHDVVVHSDFRRLGISQRMLLAVENIAKEKGCCKVTLEVLEGNNVAKQAYAKFGFEGYELDPAMGKALFWEKTLQAL